MTRRSRWFRSSVAVLASLPMMAACGEDGNDLVPRAATTATTATTVTTATSAVPDSTGAPQPGTSAPVAMRCRGTVGFTPNSEDAASDIRVTGVSCTEARTVLQAAGPLTSSGGPEELDVNGYHCVRTRTEQEPLPQAFFECTNASGTISFVRS